MHDVRPLIAIFEDHLSWHQSRIDFLAHFIVSLIRVKTVNLTEVATGFGGSSQVSSHYRRIQRFLRSYSVDFSVIARLVTSLLPLGRSWVLCMDRTNWKFGTVNINILVLAIAYRGCAIPVLWVLLDKRGNSNTQERIELMQRFLELFGVQCIDCLTADREFIGQDWIQFLKDTGIPFRIRIRNNTKIPNSRGSRILKASSLFRGLRLQESMILRKKRTVWGMKLYIISLKINGEYLIIITDHAPGTALDDYAQRWEIETLFGCLKSKGFNFEETHLRDRKRISKLLALMTLSLCWCIRLGIQKNETKKIPRKKHGRLARSLFRVGLDFLRNILLNLDLCTRQKIKVLKKEQ